MVLLGRTLYIAQRAVTRAARQSLLFSRPTTASKAASPFLLSNGHNSRLFSSYPDHMPLAMPSLSPTMTHGSIAKWVVEEGQEIAPGDVLCEIETDKATLDFECQEEGFIAKILVEAGSGQILVGKTIAVLTEEKDNVSKFADYKADDDDAAPEPKDDKPAAAEESKKQSTESSQAAPPPPSAPKSSSSSSSDTGRIFASPIARREASSRGVDLGQVRGTGPRGRILKADVAEFEPQQQTTQQQSQQLGQPAQGIDFTDVPVSNIRRVIAERLSMSKQTIPHYYLTVECRMDKVLALRQKLNAEAKDEYKLSVNDFVVKAASVALRKVPDVNASWGGDFIRQYHNVDISVAVDTGSGLITPIITDADARGLVSISQTMRDLATRAKDNKLAPHEFQGGTFTISNLGMFGVKEFKAIVNPPQSCILAVGATEDKVVASQVDGEVSFQTAKVMNVTLSADHRVVDGAVGAKWMAAFRSLMEDPIKMLL